MSYWGPITNKDHILSCRNPVFNKLLMVIRKIEFLGSFETEAQCPTSALPEYAFIGRSNVGKSSLINMLLARTDIARTSSTPGKTQTMNFFEVNEKWRIVDLPGYGYAKISKTTRKKWKSMINQYLTRRKNLVCVMSLIDSRHDLQANDLEFINSLGEAGIPFVLVYTKTDKVRHDLDGNIEDLRQALLEHWEELPQEFITSATNGDGREEILRFITEINNNADF